jgi:hypothetical protein
VLEKPRPSCNSPRAWVLLLAGLDFVCFDKVAKLARGQDVEIEVS